MASNPKDPAGGAGRPSETTPARSLPVAPSRRWSIRLLKIASGTLLGLSVVYLLAANLFLNLWFGVLFAGTDGIDIKLGRAWTLWPGDVHVRDVRIVFQDPNLQWTLDLQRAEVGVALLPLIRRTFHATRVKGEGTVFRMRHRVEPTSVDLPSVKAVPQIPEFPGPAVFEPRVPAPPISDQEYDLWTVHLEDVDVGVSELWVQQFRYLGSGRARGKFRLRPARELWVGPASLDLEPGALRAGTHTITPALGGRIDCTVHPFDVRKPKGAEVLRYFSVGIALRGEKLDLNAVRLFRPHDPREVRAAGGTLLVRVSTDHGVVVGGSRVEIEQHGLEVTQPRASGNVERAKLTLGADQGTGVASLELAGAKLAFLGSNAGAVVLERARVTARSSGVDLAKEWELRELVLDEAQAKVNDVRELGAVLAAAGLRPLAGASTLSARGSYRQKVLEGELRAAFDAVRVAAGETQIELDGSASLSAARASLETRSGALVAQLDGKKLKVSDGGGSVFDARGLRIEAHADADQGLGRGKVRAQLSTLDASSGNLRFSTRGLLEADVHDWELARWTARSTLRGTLSNLVLSSVASGLRVRAARAEIRSLSRTLPKPSRGASVGSRVAVDATLSAIRFEQGAAADALRGTAEVLDLDAQMASHANGTLDAVVRTNARGLEATAGEIRLQASPELVLEVEGFDATHNRGLLRADLRVKAFSANDPKGDRDCPWSTVDAASLSANGELRGDAGMTVDLNGTIERASIAWGDFRTKFAKAELASQFDAKAVDDAGSIELALGVREVQFASGRDGESGWRAVAPNFDLRAALGRAPDSLGGLIEMHARDVRARIGRTHFSTDVAVEVPRARFEFERQRLTGSGKLRLRELSLSLPEQRIEDWWADVSLESLELWTKSTLEGSARFSAKLRDGLPALVVLADQDELPGFVPAIFPLRDLEARGSVARRCKLTDFRVNEVAGGPFVANGRLQSVPELVRGAFLVHLAAAAPIAAGVKFGAADSGVSVFAGEGWLKEQTAVLEKRAVAAEAERCVPEPRQCGE